MNIHTTHTKVHTIYWGNNYTQQEKKRYPFRPPMLQYSYSALEKLVDASFLKNHFLCVHMKAFEEFLDMINGTKAEHMGMLQIFEKEDSFSPELLEAACTVFNHQLYWDNLSPYGGMISNELYAAIREKFNSDFTLKEKLVQTGMKHISCGWLWLILNARNELEIISTVKNENPLMKHAVISGVPLIAIDLWEHAYFSRFSHDKERYLRTVCSLINWSEVSKRYRFAV